MTYNTTLVALRKAGLSRQALRAGDKLVKPNGADAYTYCCLKALWSFILKDDQDMEVSMEVPPNHPFLSGIVTYKPSIWGTLIFGNLHVSRYIKMGVPDLPRKHTQYDRSGYLIEGDLKHVLISRPGLGFVGLVAPCCRWHT